MRILCVTDSLGMPRPGVPYEDTWIARLDSMRSSDLIIDRAERSTTTTRLTHPDAMGHYDPDIAITQLGIVDCAPRYFRQREKHVLSVLPSPIKSRIMNVIKRYRTRREKRQHLSPTDFQQNLHSYYKTAEEESCPVVSIQIAPPTNEFIRKSPEVEKAAKRFNEIYSNVAEEYENVRLKQPFPERPDNLMEDEHHPNSEGHQMIVEDVNDAIKSV